ncbi:MAG: hypothetical protein RJB13_1931, partial [Pseudomonadota bacterium]|jgi:5-(carboxyamino)imidazole ribonucleotide synthase
MLTLQTELSVIVARHPENGTVTLPAVENIHANGILETTLYPPRVSKELTAEAEQIALSIAQALDIYGMLCVEFFLVKHNEQPFLLVNEIAPRPHNSGHITRCSLTRSQFDLLAQTLMDMPISTEPISEHIQWAMWNTLGDLWRLTSRPDYTFWPKSLLSDSHVCEAMLYGKTEARTGRKMGHVILKHDSPECLFQTIDALKNTFNLESRNQNQ